MNIVQVLRKLKEGVCVCVLGAASKKERRNSKQGREAKLSHTRAKCMAGQRLFEELKKWWEDLRDV